METEDLQEKLRKMQDDQRRDINLFRRTQKLGDIVLEDTIGRNSIKSIAQRILDRKKDIDDIIEKIGVENISYNLQIDELNNMEIEVEETGLVNMDRTHKFLAWIKSKFNSLKKYIIKNNNNINSMKKVSVYDECKKVIEMLSINNKTSLEKDNILL